MKRQMVIALAGAVLAGAVMAGCTAAPGRLPAEVTCEASYRPSVTAPAQESKTLRLVPEQNGDGATVKFQDLSLKAVYVVPPTEAPALSVSVASADGKAVASSLYQLQRERRTVNQFAGGHGFTGLVYVYAPASEAELQYYCNVP